MTILSQLGGTRTSQQRDHLLHTPDSFVRAPLPGMRNATAIVHIAPAGGAAFTQYTAELEPGGSLGPSREQRFVYVLEGELRSNDLRFPAHSYAFFPQDTEVDLRASGAARAIVIEKPYVPLAGSAQPKFAQGTFANLNPEPMPATSRVLVRTMLPADPAFDMAVNIMEFAPGASLPIVEAHVMEHGLMMLEGSGIYRLNDRWYPVTAGDFIWMAPYCTQWFAAVGDAPARYLIYKDWNR